MPEMTFTVEWPDGRRERCYSPSLVMHDHLQAGRDYPVAEFVQRTRTALSLASERVQARYGMVCTSALAQIDVIERRAAALPDAATGSVRVLAMEPDLPGPPSSGPVSSGPVSPENSPPASVRASGADQ